MLRGDGSEEAKKKPRPNQTEVSALISGSENGTIFLILLASTRSCTPADKEGARYGTPTGVTKTFFFCFGKRKNTHLTDLIKFNVSQLILLFNLYCLL